MAVSDLVDICSHLTIDVEFDFYPILDEIDDEFLMHKSVEGVQKYDAYGILVKMGILKQQKKGIVVVKKKMEQLSSLLSIASDDMLRVQVNDRYESIEGKVVVYE